MTPTTLALRLALATLGLPSPVDEPRSPAANHLAAELQSSGWTRAGTPVVFPAPRFTPGQTEADERAALVALGGGERGAAELTRDAVTAPVVLKTSDVATEGGIIRRADLWFVVHARLEDVDPNQVAAGTKEGQTVEVGNMRFTTRDLTANENGAMQVIRVGPSLEWFVHSSSRLLDRLEVEATDRILANSTEGGWEIASMTFPRFDKAPSAANRWRAVVRRGANEEPGPWQPYAGGASTVSIRRLATVPGALMVEAHFAFFEPKAWFDGAPVLRSKIALVAQDRVRSLRREVAKSRKASGSRSRGTTGTASIEAAAGDCQNVGRKHDDGTADGVAGRRGGK